MLDMRRRQFMSLLAGAATWPLAAWAQQPAMPVIGFLHSGASVQWLYVVEAFRDGLKKAGYVEGQNIVIQFRWAEDQYDRLPGLAAELVRSDVAVLVAAGGPVVALAAKAATETVPIVFTAVADPVKSGLVVSLNRPGGNATGTAGLTTELDAKRLELLREMVPSADVVGVLVNPNRPGVEAQTRDLTVAAQTVGQRCVIVSAGNVRELGTAFQALARDRVGALLITADPFFNSEREEVIGLASRHAIPAIFQWRDFAAAGGLASYGPRLTDAYHQAGLYAGRILKGEKPADLPVVQPTKFELVINLKTAKALGLTIPPTLLARADEVIE
jgi:putative ABC transport system substrate-binding protein